MKGKPSLKSLRNARYLNRTGFSPYLETRFPNSVPQSLPCLPWELVEWGRLNFRLVQISVFRDSMETVQLKSSSSA
jgi:hypothetical protein